VCGGVGEGCVWWGRGRCVWCGGVKPSRSTGPLACCDRLAGADEAAVTHWFLGGIRLAPQGSIIEKHRVSRLTRRARGGTIETSCTAE